MRCFKIALVFAVVSSSAAALAQAKPADALMKSAFAKAKSEKKAVFLSFHASWCGWCHKLEGFLNKPEIKSVWDKRFVTVWLTVMESEGKKADENPGGDAWLKKYGGSSEGIPYSIVFDAGGKALADSRANGKAGGNIGYPAKPEEIAWFMSMLDKVKSMTAQERATIKKALEEEGAKIGG